MYCRHQIFRMALFAIVLSTGVTAPSSVCAAESLPIISSADADFAAWEAACELLPPKPLEKMTLRERAVFLEQYSQTIREHALTFLNRHPTDPRRWNVVWSLYPGQPRFVREWGADGADGWPTVLVDEAAAAAWNAKVTELRAAMENAGDLPEDIKQARAMQKETRVLRETFKARWQTDRNEPAPDFSVQDSTGQAVRLSAFRGKIVILDFWATWCPPCKAAMPHNQEVAARYKDQDVVFFAVCVWDTPEKWAAWLKENGSTYADIRWALDPARRGDFNIAKNLYLVHGLPAQFVINREGMVVDAIVGYVNGEVVLEAALAKAGVNVDPRLIAKGKADLEKRGGP